MLNISYYSINFDTHMITLSKMAAIACEATVADERGFSLTKLDHNNTSLEPLPFAQAQPWYCGGS